jgi:F-type H+-transporting ATPase subunit delta
MSLLARRYATALFEVAESQGATDAVLQDMQQLAEVFGTSAGQAFLADPNTKRAQLEDAVQRTLVHAHALSRNVVGVVLERRRESVLPELAQELRALVQRKAGEAVAMVETARPLADDDRNDLREQLARLTRKRITLEVRDNPELLGGVRVRVGNTLYDGSLLGELMALQHKLLAAPVTKT